MTANLTDQIATTPAYDWREDLDTLTPLSICECDASDRCPHKTGASERLAAYIERLEAERDALLAEHEAARRLEHWHPEGCRFCAAHNNAERVIRDER